MKVKLSTIFENEEKKHLDDMNAILVSIEKERNAYAEFFHRAWAEGQVARRIDYKAHGGLETWQANYRR